MAARTQGRRLPICHEQQEKVMNSLEAAKYEVSVVLISAAMEDCIAVIAGVYYFIYYARLYGTVLSCLILQPSSIFFHFDRITPSTHMSRM